MDAKKVESLFQVAKKVMSDLEAAVMEELKFEGQEENQDDTKINRLLKVLKLPCVLVDKYKGEIHRFTWLPNGLIYSETTKQTYKKPSKASSCARNAKHGVNGWTTLRIGDENGVTLNQFLEQENPAIIE